MHDILNAIRDGRCQHCGRETPCRTVRTEGLHGPNTNEWLCAECERKAYPVMAGKKPIAGYLTLL